MLQAVAHDVKNKLAELALRLFDTDIVAAALARDSAEKLAQALLLDNPEQLIAHIDAAAPADLVDELAAVNRQLFPNKIIHVDTNTAPTLWYYDVTLMRLAIANAVHNALKHCNNAITLRALENDGCLVFEVRDDGAGFNHAMLDTDWNTVAESNANIQSSNGYDTGLGLLLAYKIVCAHILEKDGIKRSGALTLSNDHGAVVQLVIP